MKKQTQFLIFIFIFFLSISSILYADGCGFMSFGRSYWRPGMMHFGFGGISMWLLLIVIIGLVVYLIVRAQKNQSSAGQRGGETPMDIAKERYARGEITKEEYEQLKKDLA